MGNRTMEDQKDARADNNLKIILLDALVGSVRLYSLRLARPSKSQLKRTQSCYSRCIRFLTQEPYAIPPRKPATELQRRISYNIPTVESRLTAFRRRTLAKWENALSLAYPDNMQYINEQLNQINHDILEMQHPLPHFQTNNGNLTQFDSNRPTRNYIHYRQSGPTDRGIITKTIIIHNDKNDIRHIPLAEVIYMGGPHYHHHKTRAGRHVTTLLLHDHSAMNYSHPDLNTLNT